MARYRHTLRLVAAVDRSHADGTCQICPTRAVAAASQRPHSHSGMGQQLRHRQFANSSINCDGNP
jgi:hypothetical protein